MVPGAGALTAPSFLPPPSPRGLASETRVPGEDGVRVHPPWCWGTRGRPVPSRPLTLRFCPLPQRRQEEGYYSRLEAERRRQHDEAERQLLEPEELGLGRPPLPRGYEPLAPGPPPPPQRTASYLQAQVLSPDALYTAKLVAYTEEEEEEEEDGGPAGQDAPSSARPSPARHPACDGIFSPAHPPAAAGGTAPAPSQQTELLPSVRPAPPLRWARAARRGAGPSLDRRAGPGDLLYPQPQAGAPALGQALSGRLQ